MFAPFTFALRTSQSDPPRSGGGEIEAIVHAHGNGQERRPRIAPGGISETGLLNAGIARLAGRVAGGGAPNIFTTLGRHRRLFRRWLRFAGALMPRGKLPRADTELVILRVAHNTGCDYEWDHHERIGQRVGLRSEEVARVREGSGGHGWSRRQSLLLQAADAMHCDGELGDELWQRLAAELSDVELIELCMLIGHYEMLAMTLKSLRVAPDGPGVRS